MVLYELYFYKLIRLYQQSKDRRPRSPSVWSDSSTHRCRGCFLRSSRSLGYRYRRTEGHRFSRRTIVDTVMKIQQCQKHELDKRVTFSSSMSRFLSSSIISRSATIMESGVFKSIADFWNLESRVVMIPTGVGAQLQSSSAHL